MMAASILIVEDEAIIADDLERTLTRLGYTVPAIVAEGARAIEAAGTYCPSLVLMDIKLRGRMDGIDAAHAIYERFGMPVVFLTSHSDPATLSRASAARPNGYVMKPFVERDLRVAIEVALHKHEVERDLRAKERWFSTTLSSIGDGVLATDEKLSVTFMNQVAERLTGWSNGDAFGKHIDEVFQIFNTRGAPLAGPAAEALSSRATTYLVSTARLLRKNGSEVLVDDSAAAIIDAAGNTLGAVVIFRDATERKELERRVSRSERLASLGTMAAGLCHEINNPLTSVLANLEYGLESYGEQMSAELRECLRDSHEAAVRIGDIVKDMRTFAQPIEERKANIELPALLDGAIKLTTHAVRQHARLLKSYSEAPCVYADPGRLTQVFVNLLINAAQSIPAGDAAHHTIEVALSTNIEGDAIIEVKDDGAGIPPEVLPHIFDPFFTTKAPKGGMGLGLSICNNIIDGFGGEISARSHPGSGTTFQVRLPASQQETPQEPTLPKGVITQRRRILIIDDEESVARAAERALSTIHQVESRHDGLTALGRLRDAEPFDLVLCDVMMPNMSGIELYNLVLAENPAQASRFAFFTGGTTTEAARVFLAQLRLPVIIKPFPAISEFRAQISALAARPWEANP